MHSMALMFPHAAPRLHLTDPGYDDAICSSNRHHRCAKGGQCTSCYILIVSFPSSGTLIAHRHVPSSQRYTKVEFSSSAS